MYALDLLGFGWSEKAIIDYDALVWRNQVVDFMKEVVKEPAILVGNRSALMNYFLQHLVLDTMNVSCCSGDQKYVTDSRCFIGVLEFKFWCS